MKKFLIIIIIVVALVFVILSRGDTPVPAGEEPVKNYVGHSAEECGRIQVLCIEGFERFDDDAGCGCQSVAEGQGTGADREADEGRAVGDVKEFIIEGQNFEFSDTVLSVARGDTVRIVFRSVQSFHDWRIEGFNTGTRRITAGQQATVEFVADQAGTFEFFCSVGNHRQLGMRGTLTVTE